ncbi:histidine phosphatase family protein [Pseudomonas sp. C27(2019)]|uniref:histidine phosphatase family protein n=1 Tax=Pseudomonas sp. C27(2019) TaxID=2604941 RepID=UPI001245B8D8|nr:histidine phosphatase family protein [Pseudomonas sp. C27(2019)]QEY58881.1 histidine phosphatase family protein [Pseudomonas sp. C27(2019)]
MITTYIDIIRHGEPVGGKVFRGHTDHHLTERGIEQFQQRIKRLDYNWQHVLSSPLLRCQQSAHWLAQEQNIAMQIEPNIAEIHFGAWENQAVATVMAEEDISQLWQDPMNFCAPQGESTAALQQRALAAWHNLLKTQQGKRVLMVTHGGVMRMLAQHLLELTPSAINKLSLPYAAVMSFKVIETEYQGEQQQWVSLESMDGTEL